MLCANRATLTHERRKVDADPMVDSSDGALGPPEDLASFFFSKKADAEGCLQLRVSYRGVRVILHWPEGEVGLADLDRLMESMPILMTAAKKEMEIFGQVRDMDQEIKDLLGGEE